MHGETKPPPITLIFFLNFLYNFRILEFFSGPPIGPRGPNPNVSCMVYLVTADYPKKSPAPLRPQGPPKKSCLSGAPIGPHGPNPKKTIASLGTQGPGTPLRVEFVWPLGPVASRLGPMAPTLKERPWVLKLSNFQSFKPHKKNFQTSKFQRLKS